MAGRLGEPCHVRRFADRRCRTSHRPHTARGTRRLGIESLEQRRLLSVAPYGVSSESDLSADAYLAEGSPSANEPADSEPRQRVFASGRFLTRSPSTAHVDGTPGDDTIEITALSEAYTVSINGGDEVRYRGRDVHVRAHTGEDIVLIYDNDPDRALIIRPSSARFTLGETGPGVVYDPVQNRVRGKLEIDDAEEITVFCQGSDDVAQFSDSPGDDTFVGKSDYAAMYGEGYHQRVRGAAEARAEATEGGHDVAKLYDSPGDDTLVAGPDSVVLWGEGFRVEAEGFEAVHAFATAGGTDAAEFHDSPGDDQSVTSPTYAALFGDEFYNRAKFFESTCAYSTSGGTDVAKLYDSPADDQFVGTPTHAALFNPDYSEQYTHGFHNTAKGFAGAHAYATAGGNDVARLYDSAEDDTFVAEPEQGALFRPGKYYNRAKFFDGVHAYATAGGTDVARMNGSDGPDTYHLGSDEAAVYRPGHYHNRAKYFDEVHRDSGDSQIDVFSGDQTRVILPVSGENSGSVEQPAVFDPSWDEISSNEEWSQGHIGRGVFLTRQNDGGEDDLPGISYGTNAVELHLFQACDGDTNGDRTLGGRDIQNIQSFALFGITEDPGPGFVWPPDWPEGDFNGDSIVDGMDISAILATGLWPSDSTQSVQTDGGVVDLLVYAGDYQGPDYPPGEAGALRLSTNDTAINGYVIKSAEGIFTGGPSDNPGFFAEDTDHQISGNMGFTLDGEHLLGDVIGDEWDVSVVRPHEDLTFIYTIHGQTGTYIGNLVVIGD